jgi:phosphatidylcholine synthase
VRTLRLRRLTFALVVLWSLLALYVVLEHFDVGTTTKVVMSAIAVYVIASDSAIRFLRSLKT